MVFEQAGWVGRDAVLMTGLNAIIYVLSTIPTWFLVDRWGRRAILLSGAVIMGLALSSTGYWMHLDVPATPNAVVASVIVFNAAFGYSWGPLPWLYPPEIMPLAHRAKGVSLSTATNWFFNWLVGQVTPTLQRRIKWRLYPMHGFFCACSFVLVYFLYPETKGVPLEEMDRVFGEDTASDLESETASLVRSRRSSSNHQSISSPKPQEPPREPQGWLSTLLRRAGGQRAQYQPVGLQDDE